MTLFSMLAAIVAASLVALTALASRTRPSEIAAPASRKSASGRSLVIASERRFPRTQTPKG